MHLPTLALTTTHSSVKGRVDMDFNAFDSRHPGKMNIDLRASLGRGDIVCGASSLMPKALLRSLPDHPAWTSRGPQWST